MIIEKIRIKLFRESDLSNTCKHIDRGKTIARDKFSRLIYKSVVKTFFGGGCQAQRKFVLQQISDICL